jgi:galactokinase
MRSQAIALFHAAFGAAPAHAASAPGRVNLLGEHTDYNGGPVLPMAIAARTTTAVGAGEPGWVDLVSARDGLVQRVRWDGATPPGTAAYVVGVLRELALQAAAPAGVRLAVASDVPVGAGLSSSAALTVSSARALTALAGVRLPVKDIVTVAHRAETEHVGVRCGIMDQTIVARARAGHALLLECGTGRMRHIRVPGGTRFLLADTGGRHDLAASAYNARREECEAALKLLRVRRPDLENLADWPIDQLGVLRRILPQPLRKRALHVVTETDRTRRGAELLARHRLRAFGKLLDASHQSCRRDYECSTPLLDVVARAARRSGAWGARLTGAGWGGNVLVLMGDRNAAERVEPRVIAAVGRAMTRAAGRDPVVLSVAPGAGARRERVE